MSWRPPHWIKIKNGIVQKATSEGYTTRVVVELTASTLVQSLVKWLNEPCTEHEPFLPWEGCSLLRSQCTECQQALRDLVE